MSDDQHLRAMRDMPINAEREQLVATLGSTFSRLVEVGLNDLQDERRVEVAQLLASGIARLRFSVDLQPFRLTAYLLQTGEKPQALFHVGIECDLPTVN